LIDHMGPAKLSLLKSTISNWWIELGEELLACTSVNSIGISAGYFNYSLLNLDKTRSPDTHFVIFKHSHDSQLDQEGFLNSKIVLRNMGFTVVLFGDPETEKFALSLFPNAHIFQETSIVLARQWENEDESSFPAIDIEASPTADPISSLVAEVSQTRFFSAVQTLASYNRYTFGNGNSLARNWIISQLQGLPGLSVTTQSFTVQAATAFNVIATILGTERPDDWVIVAAHYDSTSQSPTTAAPGAEDNGSGSAGLLEMVRIIVRHPPPSTMIFVWCGAEEQGLYGSYYHAQLVVNGGNRAKVKLAHVMDMIAYKASANPNRVLLETSSTWSNLFPIYRAHAASYTNLGIFTSTNPFGSDHMSYLNAQMPSLLTIDYEYASYPHYHRTTDLPQYLTPALGADIIRMGLGTVAQFAGYPNT